jgi:hypothetical protein
MTGRAEPSGQRWSTFLRNHSPHIAAMDLFVVPTIGFNLLYVLVIVRLARRELVWLNVTAHPTAEWIAQQITEAFPWTQTPRYLIRGRDAIYGAAVTRRRQRSTHSRAVRHIAVGAADLVDLPPSIVEKVPERPGPVRVLELAQRLRLDLADALAGRR